MNKRARICIALHLSSLLLWSVAEACDDPRKAVPVPAHDRSELENTVSYDVIAVPAPGKAEAIEGRIEMFVEPELWIPLENGTLLGAGTRLRIGFCAKLVVRFSDVERMEFLPAPFERLVAFQIER
jgi:hypothetical protein